MNTILMKQYDIGLVTLWIFEFEERVFLPTDFTSKSAIFKRDTAKIAIWR